MAYTAQQIADAIAQIESGGNYTAHSKTSSASGKYQYITGTWNGYGGYAHAYEAPPAVQDARAIHDITDKLARYGGDVSKVIMSWFLPAAVGNPTLANRVPKGNGISPNQYVQRVMKALGAPMKAAPTATATAASTSTDTAPPDLDLHDPKVQIANLLAIVATKPDLPTATAFPPATQQQGSYR